MRNNDSRNKRGRPFPWRCGNLSPQSLRHRAVGTLLCVLSSLALSATACNDTSPPRCPRIPYDSLIVAETRHAIAYSRALKDRIRASHTPNAAQIDDLVDRLRRLALYGHKEPNTQLTADSYWLAKRLFLPDTSNFLTTIYANSNTTMDPLISWQDRPAHIFRKQLLPVAYEVLEALKRDNQLDRDLSALFEYRLDHALAQYESSPECVAWD